MLQEIIKVFKVFAYLLAPFSLMAAWRLGGLLIRKILLGKYTVLNDLANIGKSRSEDERIKGTAVVCGGSIAGLWAARICADHFEEVLIVEPEAWLATDEASQAVYDAEGNCNASTPEKARTRLHQYFGAHVFLYLTVMALRRLFPNFDRELLNRGGKIVEADMQVHSPLGRLLRPPKYWHPDGKAPQTFICSRDCFERLLRYLVLRSSKRIRCVAGIVVGLNRRNDETKRLDSVTIIPSHQKDCEARTIEISASLVIDCSGGSQVGLKCLKKLETNCSNESKNGNSWDGLVEAYDINSRWRSFDFLVSPSIRPTLPIPGGYDNCGWLYSFIPIPGLENKHFVIYRFEGHRIRFSFYGWGVSVLPESGEEIKEFLSAVNTVQPIPRWIFNLLDRLLEAEDTGAVFNGSKLPGMNWIHYENARGIPHNFVAIGDAVMKVNPSFGQGCTKACAGAIVLDRLLRSRTNAHSREILSGFSSKFFKAHRDKIIDAWDGTKPMDYMFPTTTPARVEGLTKLKWRGSLIILLIELATHDEEIDALVLYIRNFVAPSTDIYAPWVLWRLLKFFTAKRLGLVDACYRA